MQLNPIRDLVVEAPLSSGHAFLSAASGLAVVDNLLCVIGDDEHHILLFDTGCASPGKLVRLIDGDLPKDAALRKKRKPDFEILLQLPCQTGSRLLSMGSGSTEQRMRGVLIELSELGKLSNIGLLDLQPLFAAISPQVPQINLEGAVLNGDRLLLFNRGNMQFPGLTILDVPVSAVLNGGPVDIALRAELALPRIKDVPLTVTDACRLDNGLFVLSAVAEATADSYADGALLGTAIVVLDSNFAILAVEPVEPTLKIEGIVAQASTNGIDLLCVTDADDPGKPAALYSGRLTGQYQF
jgi:hypothetical protein